MAMLKYAACMASGIAAGFALFFIAVLYVGDWTGCLVIGPPDILVGRELHGLCDYVLFFCLLLVALPAVFFLAFRLFENLKRTSPLAGSRTERKTHAGGIAVATAIGVTLCLPIGLISPQFPLIQTQSTTGEH